MMIKPNSLQKWLDGKQRPSIEVAFISGKLIDWILKRFVQFGARRVLLLSLISFRYLYCLQSFVWFSWQDLIFHISLISLIVGFQFGAMENFKKTGTGLRTARLISGVMVLVIICLFIPPLISKILFQGYIPNVFDEARIIIALKAISQIYRNLENAIQIRRGTPPLPLTQLLGMETSLVLVFLTLTQFFGALPSVLFWIILLDSLVSEAIQWRWVLKQPYRKVISWMSVKDLKHWPEINSALIFSSVVGCLLFAERFLLVGITSGLGEKSVAMYYYLIPLVSMVWRFPHLFHRYFRKDGSALHRLIAKSLFFYVFSLGIIFGLILFTALCLFFESNLVLPFVILFMGPVSAILAYTWYRGEVYKFLLVSFWVFKIFGLMDLTLPVAMTALWIVSSLYQIFTKSKWKEITFRLERGSPVGVAARLKDRLTYAFELRTLYGKVYSLSSAPENLPLIKKELFALSLGSIEFNPKTIFDMKLNQDHGFVVLGSIVSRKLKLSQLESEFILNKIKKSIGQGHAKTFTFRNKKISFGMNSMNKYGLRPSDS